MSALQARRILRPEDLLYRRVMPEHWDEEGLLPAAFEDRHEDLSFFAARVKSAAEVLEYFAGFAPVKRRCGTGKRKPTPAEMYDAGYRIAEISFASILANTFAARADENGNQLDRNGHVDVIRGQELAATWASEARILSRDETLGP
jgi:hypothetical protein